VRQDQAVPCAMLVSRIRILDRTAVGTRCRRLYVLPRHSLLKREADVIRRIRNILHVGCWFVVNGATIDLDAPWIDDYHLRRGLCLVEMNQLLKPVERLKGVLVLSGDQPYSIETRYGAKSHRPVD